MRLYKSFLFIFSILLFFACKSHQAIPRSYDYTPVLLHLSVDKQPDSIGFNLVEAIPELLYPRILTGDLPIWEDSRKRAVQGPNKIQALEKIATRPFVRSNNLFIHQYWQIFKRNFKFGIQGFTFTGKTPSGNVVNYGYIDGPDIITLLKSEYIPMNANGYSNVTYWEALHTMKFDFNLVQFGNNDFKQDARPSAALQYQAVYDPKIFRNFQVLKPVKEITYKILSPSISTNKENKTVYNVLETYINENKQTILNATNSEYFFSNMYKSWNIENVTIIEEWEQTPYLPLQRFKGISLFIDQHAIDLSAKQLEEMNIQINLQGFAEYLSEKRFSLLLEKVNSEEIAPQNSENVYSALLQKNWNQIN